MNIIVIDTETTGLNISTAEILQISIISGSGIVLFNKYIKPEHTTSWPAAQAIHHISPAKVKKCKTIDYYVPRIQRIIDSADIVIGYNLEAYDLPILANAGISIGAKVVDVFLENRDATDIARHRLIDVAKKFGYTFTPHDALEDCRATLHIYNKTHPVNKSHSRVKFKKKTDKKTAEINEKSAFSASESNLLGRILKKIRTAMIIVLGVALIIFINRYTMNYFKGNVSIYVTMVVVGLLCYLYEGLTGAITGMIGYLFINPMSAWNLETVGMEISIFLTALVLRVLFKYTKRYKSVIVRIIASIVAIAVSAYVFFILCEYVNSNIQGVPFVLPNVITEKDPAVWVAVSMISALPLYMIIARILRR